MTKLKIKITKQILEKSKYCGTDGHQWDAMSSGCAIALALRDVFPDALVRTENIIIYKGDFDSLVSLPAKAKFFIVRFDRSTPEQRVLMPEFEFEIDIPDEVIEKINIDDLVNHQTLELSF